MVRVAHVLLPHILGRFHVLAHLLLHTCKLLLEHLVFLPYDGRVLSLLL